MSRNLKGGAKKGFNFAAFGGDDDSSGDDSPVMQMPARSQKNERIKFPEIDTDSPVMTLPSAAARKKKFEPLVVDSPK